MIARSWDGLTRAEAGEEYADYVRRTGFRDLLATSGNRGALVLRRREGTAARFRVLSLWDGEEAIRRFAGDDPERARYYPEDARYLESLPSNVEHFEVVAEGGLRPGDAAAAPAAGAALARGERLAREIDTLARGENWHGPTLEALLAGVSAEQAARRPFLRAHSIWELVLHVTAWTDVFRRRLSGTAVEEPEAGDFPPPPGPTETAWHAARKALFESLDALSARVRALSQAELERKVPGRPFDAEFQVHAAIRHVVYHSGQIALLKKGA
jgi:uncharacterized damage-inducible protein DinB/heme-degrading monooxygenase HmoA